MLLQSFAVLQTATQLANTLIVIVVGLNLKNHRIVVGIFARKQGVVSGEENVRIIMLQGRSEWNDLKAKSLIHFRGVSRHEKDLIEGLAFRGHVGRNTFAVQGVKAIRQRRFKFLSILNVHVA